MKTQDYLLEPLPLKAIVAQLKMCNYETKDGHNLKNNSAFVALEQLAQEQEDNYDGPQKGEAWSDGFAENH